jgi:glycosyltransferase involved in cell wall biosynthesis
VKKVLIITYYWPPEGGIGVLRCLKIAKYLRQYGWEPIIYTADKKHFDHEDESNYSDIPADLKIIKGKIWEPYGIYKLLRGKKRSDGMDNVFYVKEKKESFIKKIAIKIRGNFFIPDARAMWIRPSVRILDKYLQENTVDAIISNGPPHSNTRIATILKKKHGIPWLADFQDPWTQVDYFQLFKLSKRADRLHRRQEQEVFKFADKITIVSPSWKKDLESIGAQDCEVIPWGYDLDDYQNIEVLNETGCVLTHIGILGYDRLPSSLLEAMAELAQVNPLFREKFKLKLVGSVDKKVMEIASGLGISKMLDLTGNVKRDEALSLAKSSSALLLLLNRQVNARGRIPAKIFEYLALRKNILALGEKGSDISAILSETKAGLSIEYGDTEEIKSYLADMFVKYEEGHLNNNIDSQIQDYDVSRLVGKMAKCLDEITTNV